MGTLNAAQRQRQAVRNFLSLAPDTRVRIMREEFGWQDAIDWEAGGWNAEMKLMMNHVRDTHQRERFIDRFVDQEADADV